ncbi:MAG: hypothetical protein Q9195_003146 [Heterodermia aff. obscurata]
MLSNIALGFLLSSTIAVVSGQSSSAFDTSALDNAIPSVLAIPSVQSALEAQATAIATNPTLLAALSSVPGISTKDVAADLASAFDEVATGQTSVTASALQYLNAIPTTGPANSIVNSAFDGVLVSALNDNPGLFSKTSVSFYIGTQSQASGAAKPTGVAGTGSQPSGVARSSGAAGTKSTGANSTGANSTGAQSSGTAATTVAPNSSQAAVKSSSSTSSTSSAPTSQSTNGGMASQPTGAIVAAGAAAAGVLGFAAFL